MLWRNDKAVIIGKNQNAANEVDLEFAEKNGIKVIRRLTGGGAVFHDAGNINYTVIENGDGGHFSDYAYFTAGLTDFLETLGVKAELSGRNDVLVGGKKVCGNAQCVKSGMVMHHGCILYSADLSELSGALKVKDEKIKGKGIKSVSSRVTNLAGCLGCKMDVTEFLDAFGDFMSARHGCEKYYFSEYDIEQINKIKNKKYLSWEWNFGRSPEYNFKNYKKFDFGLVEVGLFISGGVIKSAKISGDFFGRLDVSELEAALTGARHSAEAAYEALKNYDIGGYISGSSRDELISLLIY